MKSLKTRSPEVSPRVRIGASFERFGDQLRVASVIPGLPAHTARLRAGDVVSRFGTVDATKHDAVRQIALKLRARRAVRLDVLRRGRRVMVSVVAELTVFGDNDIVSPVVKDKRCDAKCDCTKPRKDTFCGTTYINKGRGPNGGVLLQPHCVALTKAYVIIDDHYCEIGEFI
jgi:PDZ domain-containing protein